MTTLTEMVATVVLHSSAAVFSHFGVTVDATQVSSPPAAEQRVIARSPRKLDRAEKVLKVEKASACPDSQKARVLKA
jgi:hypothetical protein